MGIAYSRSVRSQPERRSPPSPTTDSISSAKRISSAVRPHGRTACHSGAARRRGYLHRQNPEDDDRGTGPLDRERSDPAGHREEIGLSVRFAAIGVCRFVINSATNTLDRVGNAALSTIPQPATNRTMRLCSGGRATSILCDKCAALRFTTLAKPTAWFEPCG